MAECIAIGGRDGFQPVTEPTDKVNSADGEFVYLEAPHHGSYDEAMKVSKGTIRQDCEGRCPLFREVCFPQSGVDSRRTLIFMLNHYPTILGLNQNNKHLYK